MIMADFEEPTYTLYSYWRSSCSWRVRLCLELKGIKYTLKPVNLLKEEHKSSDYLAINPAGSLPALITKNGTALGQSVAIAEFLEDAHPDRFPLLPKDLEKRAQVRRLVQIIVADCQPLQNMKVLKFVGIYANKSSPEVLAEWAKPMIEGGLVAYVAALAQSGNGRFSCGDEVTIADLCLIPQLYNARRFGVNIEEIFPRLAEIEANVSAAYPEEYQRAHPDGQPDKQ